MSKLSLAATAIGSLPYSDEKVATTMILENFEEIPFWPQLAKVSNLEDMIIQYTQNIPGMEINIDQQYFVFNPETDEFFEKLEEFYLDYDEILNEKNFEKLEKYGITPPYTSSIELFCEKLKSKKTNFAKGHITGPFTWGTSICDKNNKCIFYDETYRDILVKALTLKALWQIKKFKEAHPETTPIIFIDEPTMSQFGTSAFITVHEDELVDSLKQITEVLQAEGALVGVHCCGKADWNMVLKSGINIMNFDAYSFSKNLTVYSKKIHEFLSNGGYIAWGIVPTLDTDALTAATKESLLKKLEDGINALAAKGIDKNLILKQSIITPSCGAGCLTPELAEKAMNLTTEISKEMKLKYEGI